MLKFGRLTIIQEVKIDDRKRFLCQCSCGNKKVIRWDALKAGATTSCGCYREERKTKHGYNKRYTGVRTKTYAIWMNARDRCNNPKNKDYARYGGRGITWDKSWNDYNIFLLEMGDAPQGLSLDRIDNNKGYGPGNCRWATRKEQANNTRTNVYYQWKGQNLTLSQLRDIVGIPRNTIYNRLLRGWSLERALTEGAKS